MGKRRGAQAAGHVPSVFPMREDLEIRSDFSTAQSLLTLFASPELCLCATSWGDRG